MSLPPARKKSCHECPWRRTSIQGWLGPWTSEEWIALARSDEPIACHATIPEFVPENEAWDDPGIRQCAGAAQYRKNLGKLPRNPEVATAVTADRDSVFASPVEFEAHHQRGPR